MIEELISLVTIQDVEIGVADKFEAHRYPAQLHRAISVWIQNNQDEVLLQKRSDQKIVGAGWWANTVCGNVWHGESYEACAVRRLQHELGIGIDASLLKKQKKFEYKAYCNEVYGEHEMDQLFVMQNLEASVRANPAEVAETLWVPWDELLVTVKHAVAEGGYYTTKQSVAASWNELAENMVPLSIVVKNTPMLLAPWTVMMIAEDIVSFD